MLPVIVIVAIGWIFVVLLMSLTETSFVAGIMTFLFYCVLPLSIIIYLFGTNARRRRRQENNSASASSQSPSGPPNNSHDGNDGNN
jgi:ABC-type transport system involved in cytochrome bd biosynthesis fused ATPase/permease subunit